MNARRHLFLPLLMCAAASVLSTVRAQPSAVAPHVTSERDSLTPAQKKAETNVKKLLAHASTAQSSGDFQTALRDYELAIDVLEGAYGAEHPRLAEPLGAMAAMFMQQYDIEYLMRGRRVSATLKSALDLQQRIVGIYEHANGIDPALRISALERLGGCYLLMKKDAEGIASYTEAWRLQAELVSKESADEMYAEPELVGLYTPDNSGGHEPWIITVTYDVGADGRVSVVDVQGDDVGDLRRQMRKAYEQARARPAFVGGKPTDARSLSIRWSYRRDGGVTRVQ
jgi:hypothetical protein